MVLRQHFGPFDCPVPVWQDVFDASMERKKKMIDKDVKEKGLYDLSTPLWDKYYRKVRDRIRFPRYYKKALNW